MVLKEFNRRLAPDDGFLIYKTSQCSSSSSNEDYSEGDIVDSDDEEQYYEELYDEEESDEEDDEYGEEEYDDGSDFEVVNLPKDAAADDDNSILNDSPMTRSG